MTTNYNRNYCFNCGEEVDPNDYEEIGNNIKLWVCEKKECNRELRNEIRAFNEENSERQNYTIIITQI